MRKGTDVKTGKYLSGTGDSKSKHTLYKQQIYGTAVETIHSTDVLATSGYSYKNNTDIYFIQSTKINSK